MEKHIYTNIAKVAQLSPFRYPGGKTWLVPYFADWLRALPRQPEYLVEPFAGGGIISLSAVCQRMVRKSIMVEKDEDVASVWKTILHGDWKWLVGQICALQLNAETVGNIIGSPAGSCEEGALRTILKNRISYGGIITGGILKRGEAGKGIASRWYPETIAGRIRTIAAMRDRLEFCEGDAFEYIKEHSHNKAACFFIDPPYTASTKKPGKRLYRYNIIDHERLFAELQKVKGSFLLTYDFDKAVVSLAAKCGFGYTAVPMRGTHNSLRHELLISNTNSLSENNSTVARTCQNRT